MTKLGVFGGSFDPVHFGHLHLAISLYERHKLDEVWWIPAKKNPLKGDPPLEDQHRLAMLKLALEGLDAFKVIDHEMKSPGLSFTVDTIRWIKAQFPDKQPYLMLGDDAICRFMEWKEPEELLRLAKPLICAREFHQLQANQAFSPFVKECFQNGFTKTPLIEISATDVRERLKKRLFTGHLIPSKVLDYIELNRLYLPL